MAALTSDGGGGFEGPEKNLEVCFTPGVGHVRGCRALPRTALEAVLTAARCEILSTISNDHVDAYVLSESSLFVYKWKMVLKTCGRTTLLQCLGTLLQLTCGYGAGGEADAANGEAEAPAASLGLELEWVGYSRKNYNFPDDQVFPHSDFGQELAYLRAQHSLATRLSGSGHVLGPITGDHWFVYVADKCDRPAYSATERTLNVMMFDLSPAAAATFHRAPVEEGLRAKAAGAGADAPDDAAVAREMTRRAGIDALCPGAIMDACAFSPCGYSMNAITFDSYATIHITPEPEGSYASFETNAKLRSYAALVNNVLRVFGPKRFVLTLFADEAGLAELAESPFDKAPSERLTAAPPPPAAPASAGGGAPAGGELAGASGAGPVPLSPPVLKAERDPSAIVLPGVGVYERKSVSATTIESDCACRMATYQLVVNGAASGEPASAHSGAADGADGVAKPPRVSPPSNGSNGRARTTPLERKPRTLSEALT